MALDAVARKLAQQCPVCGSRMEMLQNVQAYKCTGCRESFTELELVMGYAQPIEEWLQNKRRQAEKDAPEKWAQVEAAMQLQALKAKQREYEKAQEMREMWEKSKKDAYWADMGYLWWDTPKWEKVEVPPPPPEMHTLQFWGGPLDKQLAGAVHFTDAEKAQGRFNLKWPEGAYYQRELLDGEWVMMYYGTEDEGPLLTIEAHDATGR